MGDNKRLEAIWRQRVHAAEERYSVASAHCCKIQAEYRDGQLPPSDGGYALQQALKAESETRAEYMRVLHILTRLLVAGELPEEIEPEL